MESLEGGSEVLFGLQPLVLGHGGLDRREPQYLRFFQDWLLDFLLDELRLDAWKLVRERDDPPKLDSRSFELEEASMRTGDVARLLIFLDQERYRPHIFDFFGGVLERRDRFLGNGRDLGL